jgi:ribosomal protein S18 acetylase RimI-like enzyme
MVRRSYDLQRLRECDIKLISGLTYTNYDVFIKDLNQAEEILRLNHQIHDPIADGVFPTRLPDFYNPKRELEYYDNGRSIGFIAKKQEKVVGFIRGSYDGNRAIIQQLSVHPEFQGHGIGTRLTKIFSYSLLRFGLKSVGVISASSQELNSVGFYKKLGFVEVPAKLLVHQNIPELISSNF